MDVSEQARVLRSRWVIVAAVVAVGLAALAVFGRGPKPKYQATAVLVFDESGNPPRDAFVQDLTAASALARTPLVATKAVARLNAVNSPEDLASLITTRANVAANTVEITTLPLPSASKARLLANGFAAELAGSLNDQQGVLSKRASDAATAEQQAIADSLRTVEGKLAAAAKAPIDQQEALRAQRDAILRHLQDTIVADLSQPRQQSLTSIGSATLHKIDHDRLAPTTVPGWMLAAGVLAFLGCAIALVVERIDGRLRGRSSAERAFGLPVLAEIPPFDGVGVGVVAATRPLSPAADAFRDLRTSLARLGRPPVRHGAGRGPQLELTSALVTSAGPAEAKTSTAVNLAATVAETGKSVLVIDCDLRHPDAHEQLGVDPGPGLSDVLLGAASLDQVAVPTTVPGVQLVGAGRAAENPAALLARQHDFVALARMLADFVILDAPSLSVHDASELVWMVDVVVVACRRGTTKTRDAEHVNELLGILGAPPAGVVLLTSDRATDDGAAGDGRAREVAPPYEPIAVPPPPSPPAQPAPPPAPPAPPAPEPVGSGGGSIAYAASGSVGVLARPAPPVARPQPRAQPDAADWATRAEPQEAGADSDTIRRQLALPVRRVASWGATLGLMVAMWFVIRAFLFQSFYIPSPSMAPALQPGDRVLVSKLSYRLHDIHRGDIVVFKRPPHLTTAEAGPEVKDLVKRVIGLPGDTVEARDGQVIVNGTALKEPYVAKGAVTTPLAPTHIDANHYWVMGDNRGVSEDSRVFGTISNNLIVGRVFFQVWPVSSFGLV